MPSPQLPPLDGTSAVLEGEPIFAPLSGRPCLAYDVGLRSDDDGHGALGTWLLVEQGTAPLVASSTTIPEGKAWLELPERTRHRPESPGDEERLHRFLRERGFTSAELVVFETIVEPHVAVKASSRDGRIVIERGQPELRA